MYRVVCNLIIFVWLMMQDYIFKRLYIFKKKVFLYIAWKADIWKWYVLCFIVLAHAESKIWISMCITLNWTASIFWFMQIRIRYAHGLQVSLSLKQCNTNRFWKNGQFKAQCWRHYQLSHFFMLKMAAILDLWPNYSFNSIFFL